MPSLTAFQDDAFQLDAFQIYSSLTGQAIVGITEVSVIYAKVAILETVPVYANIAVVVPGSTSITPNANVSIYER